jgi:hypothetical protein
VNLVGGRGLSESSRGRDDAHRQDRQKQNPASDVDPACHEDSFHDRTNEWLPTQDGPACRMSNNAVRSGFPYQLGRTAGSFDGVGHAHPKLRDPGDYP